MKKIFATILVITLLLTSLIPVGSVFAAEVTSNGRDLVSYNTDISPITQAISPNFKLINNGTNVINLSDVQIRYNFTNDGISPNTFKCIWSTVGAQNVTGTFGDITPCVEGADRYCEIGFKSVAGVLAPGQSIEVKLQITKDDLTAFDQTNDSSFNEEDTDYPPCCAIYEKRITITVDLVNKTTTTKTEYLVFGLNVYTETVTEPTKP